MGGGNAGQAQSIDPSGSGYIAPTPKPPVDPPTKPPGGGGGDVSTPASVAPGVLDLAAANTLLNALGINDIGKTGTYKSVDLPETGGMDNDQFILKAQDGGYLDGFEGGTNEEAILYAQDKGFNPQFVAEGISTPGESGSSPADTADNNRSVSIPGEEPTDWMKPREKSFEEKRREAFLNLDNRGYAAIRAADAATDRVRQGDKFFYKVGDELKEVNEDTYRKGQHTQLSADEIKSGYVNKIKDTLVPVAESGVFEKPSADMPDMGTTQKQSPVDMSPGQTAEFEINNNPPISEISRQDMKINYFAAKDDDDED